MKNLISLLAGFVLTIDGAAQTPGRAATENWTTNRIAQAVSAVNTNYGPRVTALESGTNGWNAAYSWGNHAVAGYLLGSAWNTWLSTNTYVKTELDQTALAALAAFASTNNLTRWRLSSTNWLEYAGNGVITNFILTPVMTGPWWHFEGADFIESDIPHPVNVVVTDRWSILYDGNGYEFNLVGSEWWGYLAVFDDQNGPVLLTNRVSFAETNLVYSLVPSSAVSTNFVVYNLTTGNVWQAVGEAKTAADDAQLAADQAATLVNYHTTLDGNPHAGKFVSMSNGTATNLTIAGGNVSGDTLIGAQAITNIAQSVSNPNAITNNQSGVTFTGNTYVDYLDASSGIGTGWLTDRFFSRANIKLSFVEGVTIRVGPTDYYNTITAHFPIDGCAGFSNCVTVAKDLTVKGTNAAAVIVSQGALFVGPTIDGKQAHLFSNGTNLFFVNVNYVTNSITTN